MENSSDSLTSVLTALRALGDGGIWTAMLALAAAGVVSMAILQIVKEVSPLRRWFQHRWFEGWIESQARCMETDIRSSKTTGSSGAEQRWSLDTAAAKRDVVELSTGGLSDAFYDQPIEDMVTQVNAAAMVILDEAKRYRALLLVLARGASLDDVDTVEAGQPTNGSAQRYFDARARLGRRIQRNLEGVQIACGSRWKFWMQVAALTLSAAVVELAILRSTEATLGTFLIALMIGIVGGYIAPITRDLVAALQKLRAG